jgi:hypothetical protein
MKNSEITKVIRFYFDNYSNLISNFKFQSKISAFYIITNLEVKY